MTTTRAHATDLEIIERIAGGFSVSPALIAKVTAKKHKTSDLVDPIRGFLFGVFEFLNSSPQVFTRWRTEDHKLEHKTGCRHRGKADWRIATAGDDLYGTEWLIMREMERRVLHLNEVAIPGLGIRATAMVLPPRIHRAVCPKCKEVANALSVTVEIIWCEIAMRREYDLGW